jgi:hypothetical protein
MDHHPPPYRPNARGTFAEKARSRLFDVASENFESEGPISIREEGVYPSWLCRPRSIAFAQRRRGAECGETAEKPRSDVRFGWMLLVLHSPQLYNETVEPQRCGLGDPEEPSGRTMQVLGEM